MLSEDYAASFQEYFDAYYEEILKYCYIHLGYNQTHAQECCQEVFLLCLQKQPAFPTPDGLKVWLYRTAKFQVKKMLRNLQTEQARLDYYQERPEGAEAGAFAYQPDLDAALELPIEVEPLKVHVLGKLNTLELELYHMYYTEDWPCREIAKGLGASENTIYQRLSRLRIHILREVHNLGLA